MYSKLPHIDYTNLSPKDLKEVQDRAHAAERSFQAQRKAEARQELIDHAASKGFTLAELYGGKPSSHKSHTVAIKYQDPDNSSDTWTGRGRKPNWLVAKINKGGTLENFELRVRQPVATISKKPAKRPGKRPGGKGGTRPKKLFVCPTDPTKTWGGYGHKPDWHTPELPNVYGQAA